jgi:hypothetical protein
MAWHVKSRDEQGKVTSTLCHSWEEAIKLREESQVNGLPNIWIENEDGQRVGFTQTKPPAVKGY